MPVFNGEDPDGWIFRAERYFALSQSSETEKLEAAVVSMEGEALAWFQWEDGRRAICNWLDIKRMIMERFRPTQEGSLHEKFLTLRQETTVREYRRQFEVMAAPLAGMPEQVLEENFIK